MAYLILLLVVISAPSLFALYRLVQRKRNYRKAVAHWDKLQRRIDDGYVD